jgi:hypothetical protein
MPALKRLTLLAALPLLQACATTTPISVTDTSCRGFVPILYSRKDTPGTISQAREHNAAWDALCKRN